MKRHCSIVKDLWPLYIDGELSETSTQFIKEHLSECPNCQKLANSPLEIDLAETLFEPSHSSGSAEEFMLRVKKRLQIILGGLLVGTLIIIGVTWSLSDWQSGQAYKEKALEERQYIKQQVIALDEVSPPAKEVLNKLGLNFSINEAKKTADVISLKYSINWSPESHIEWVSKDTHWYIDSTVIDPISGSLLQPSGGGSSSSKRKFSAHTEVKLDESRNIDKVMLKTEPLYAFSEGYAPNISIKFDFSGDLKTVNINKPFSYGGVEFVIDSMDLNTREFKVNYRQLTPAAEAGVYLLNFEFDDRLGNTWGPSPTEADLSVRNPKQFSINAPNSPSKHWQLKVKHVVQVIPGINAKVNLDTGGA